MVSAIDDVGKVMFRIIGMIVRLAPIGAFGAMAFTIGAYGIHSLVNLFALILTFYGTSLIFVLLVLGRIARFSGFSIFRFIAYIKDELLIVLGTSSSETVLPHMIQKMERLGASRSVVGLVIPVGYSFNLDGTNIYMTLATLFLAQATNTPLTLTQELTILLVAMLTSKGASGVTGAGSSRLPPILCRRLFPVYRIDSARHSGRHRQIPRVNAVHSPTSSATASATIALSAAGGASLDKEKLHEAMAHPRSKSSVRRWRMRSRQARGERTLLVEVVWPRAPG